MECIVAFPRPSLSHRDRSCRCNIDPETHLGDLLDQLCEKYPNCAEDLKNATFWKANGLGKAEVYGGFTQKLQDWTHRNGKVAQIPRDELMMKNFPDGPHDASLEQVDILVITPQILEATRGDAVCGSGYIKVREEMFRAIERAPPPSECVKSSAAIMEAVLAPSGPRYGRPSHRFGPPTALFSEPLAFLRHDLEHLEPFEPDSATLDLVLDLLTSSAGFFDERCKRETTLRPILRRLLLGDSQWRRPTADETEPYGVWLEGPFTYLIIELKNEQGLEGDPFLQGLLAYGKLVTRQSCAPYFGPANFPTILLSIAGNHLTISSAIFTNAAIYADELLSIKLCGGHRLSDDVLHIARVFIAINYSTKLLRGLYRNLLDDPHPSPLETKVLWPTPTADPPESAELLPRLEFFYKVNRVDGSELSVIDEKNENHAMHLARMQTGTLSQVVFVKFTPNYHKDAHRLLAGQNPPLASALHSCMRVTGGLYMVVMEYIPKTRGRSISPYASTAGSLVFPPQLLAEVVHRDVAKDLCVLRGQGLVFGGLRESNLLYLPEDGGRTLLVDFDGVGRDTVDRYPACLDPVAAMELDVMPWEIMKRMHDRENFRRLIDRLSRRIQP